MPTVDEMGVAAAERLREEMTRFVNIEAMASMIGSASPSSRRSARRDRWRVVLAAAILAVLGVGGLTVLVRRQPHDRPSPPALPPPDATAVAPAPTTPPETTSAVPGTSALDTAVTADTTGSALVCPAPADYFSVVRSNSGDVGAADLESLQSDLQAVSAITFADFAGYEVTADHPAKIKVWVDGDVAKHTAEIEALVQHPDRLLVVPATHSQSDMKAIEQQVVAEAQSRPQDFIEFSYGATRPMQVISFGLAPGDEALAQQYVDRWGDAVRIQVGDVVFVPPGCGNQPLSRKCADVIGDDPATAGLSLSLTAATPTIEQRGSGTATLTVTNNGSQRFTMDIGSPISGVLVHPGSTQVVGVVGGVKGVGVGVDLSEGESAALDVSFAAFRCDGGVGSAAPAGGYGLRVLLSSEDSSDSRVYLSPEVPVVVTTNDESSTVLPTLPPTAGTGLSDAPVRGCDSSNLLASGGPVDGAMGTYRLDVTVTNTGPTCILPSVPPTLTGIDATGRAVPLPALLGPGAMTEPPPVDARFPAAGSVLVWIWTSDSCYASTPQQQTWSQMRLEFPNGISIPFTTPLDTRCGINSITHLGSV